MNESEQSVGRKTVIVGGVAGGASCAARLRRLDEGREIVLLERGPYISYANCGLPYHVGGTIRRREALLVTSPETMRKRFRVDVRTGHEAVGIDRARKVVAVRTAEGESYEESYDDLVLATGSEPVRPPLPGIDLPQVRTLWTVPDAVEVRTEMPRSRSTERLSVAAVPSSTEPGRRTTPMRYSICSVSVVFPASTWARTPMF